jgi:hypothetical protein
MLRRSFNSEDWASTYFEQKGKKKSNNLGSSRLILFPPIGLGFSNERFPSDRTLADSLLISEIFDLEWAGHPIFLDQSDFLSEFHPEDTEFVEFIGNSHSPSLLGMVYLNNPI